MSLIFYNLIERDNGSLLKLIVLIFSDYYALLYFTFTLLWFRNRTKLLWFCFEIINDGVNRKIIRSLSGSVEKVLLRNLTVEIPKRGVSSKALFKPI